MDMLQLKPKDRTEYQKLDMDLCYKEDIGFITPDERALILETWLVEHGY